MPNSELYLIAHKVRGEPAFDVAERINIGDEEGWIIPTSGHRAYPYWHLELDVAVDWELVRILHEPVPPMPADLEDHYTVRADPKAPPPTASALLTALGLGRPKVTIQRRV
jgi:hypothetical protein